MDALNPLLALGLNRLEADIYIYLLSESPATGYRIAQALGKPVANCYKALEMLVKKGAIEADEGKKRLYIPTPPAEFLRRLRQQLQANMDAFEKQFRETKPSDGDLRIYQMTNSDQIFERSRTLLQNARKAVVADVFPVALKRLSPIFERAGARKLEIIVKCYKGESIPGVQTVRESRSGEITGGYPGQWIKIVADAREHVIAFLSNDLKDVYQAVWSRSPFLSILHFNAIKSEMLLDQINSALGQARSLENIKNIIKTYNARAKKYLPGYVDLTNIHSKGSGGEK